MASTDTNLLDILEAHGQTFLDSFKPLKAEKNKRKRDAGDTAEAHRSTKLVRTETDKPSSADNYSDSAEEWNGFGSDARVDDEYEIHSSSEEEASLEGVLARLAMANGKAHCHRESLIASTSIHKPDVVVFSGYGPKTLEPLSKKMQGKAFMVCSFLYSRCCHLDSPLKSSNVSKLRDVTQEEKKARTADSNGEDDEL